MEHVIATAVQPARIGKPPDHRKPGRPRRLDKAGPDERAVVGMILHWRVELERLVPE